MSGSGDVPGLDIPDPSSPEFSESRGHLLAITASVCIVVATVFAALRFYVRKVLIRKVGIDDWAFLVSAVGKMTDYRFANGYAC